jgi:hypothetical protein
MSNVTLILTKARTRTTKKRRQRRAESVKRPRLGDEADSARVASPNDKHSDQTLTNLTMDMDVEQRCVIASFFIF